MKKSDLLFSLLLIICTIGVSVIEIEAEGTNNSCCSSLDEAIQALQISVGLPSTDVDENADINGDGRIGLEEAIYALQIVSTDSGADADTRAKHACSVMLAQCGQVRDRIGTLYDCGECASQGEMCVSNQCEPICSSADFGGATADIFLHLPFHIADKDISINQHDVDVDFALPTDWQHKAALNDKTVSVDLGATQVNGPMTISLRVIPDTVLQNGSLLSSNLLDLNQANGTLVATLKGAGGDIVITADQSSLKDRTCNHFAIVIDDGNIDTYFNLKTKSSNVDTSGLNALTGALSMGPYLGRVWEVRGYDRVLSLAEITELGEECADDLVAEPFEPGFVNYLCGIHFCEWWEDGANTTTSSLQYYIKLQDRAWERNVMDIGMYEHGQLRQYLADGLKRHSYLSSGLINGFVNLFSYENPMTRTQYNSQHWLHENFHSFHGVVAQLLTGSSGFFLNEATTSWAPDFVIPAIYNDMLGAYTLHPHLTMWATDPAQVGQVVGAEIATGHAYGAYIFFHYLTNYVTSWKFIGKIWNEPVAGPEPIRAVYEQLEALGFDLRDVFSDFAARIVTWDIDDGDLYLEWEDLSRDTMISWNPNDPDQHDNKIIATYDSAGTGDIWTAVPTTHLPGSWAYNVYKVNVDTDRSFAIDFKPSISNPAYTEFRVQVVVYDATAKTRTYTVLNVGAAGEETSATVGTLAGNEIYLVIATTPSTIFSGFSDVYEYEYRIRPQ